MAFLLSRDWPFVLAVFTLTSLFLLAPILLLSPRYTSSAKVLIGTNVQSLAAGHSSRAWQFSDHEEALAEAALLDSVEVKIRAVRALGVESFLPPMSGAPTHEDEAAAVRQIALGFSVVVMDGGPVVSARFTDSDPRRAERVLDALLEHYQAFRLETLKPGDVGNNEPLRAALNDAEARYRDFLRIRGIGDFAAAHSAAAAGYASVSNARLETRARLSQVERRLSSLNNQIQRFEQDTVSASYSSSEEDRQDSLRQRLETERALAVVERDELSARLRSFEAQLAELRGKQASLNASSVEHDALSYSRDIVANALRHVQVDEMLGRLGEGVADNKQANIRVIDRVSPAAGPSLGKLPLILSALGASILVALLAGLARAVWHPKIITPAMAERVFGARVLSVIPVKRS